MWHLQKSTPGFWEAEGTEAYAGVYGSGLRVQGLGVQGLGV